MLWKRATSLTTGGALVRSKVSRNRSRNARYFSLLAALKSEDAPFTPSTSSTLSPISSAPLSISALATRSGAASAFSVMTAITWKGYSTRAQALYSAHRQCMRAPSGTCLAAAIMNIRGTVQTDADANTRFAEVFDPRVIDQRSVGLERLNAEWPPGGGLYRLAGRPIPRCGKDAWFAGVPDQRCPVIE